LALDFLYLSDGWLRNSSENCINNIKTLEVYHEIRGNLHFFTGDYVQQAQGGDVTYVGTWVSFIW
jgi:hypothetical protein